MPLSARQPSASASVHSQSDAELVARALRGERASREQIYRRHAAYLLAISIRLMASRSEGEDVVQDTFVLGFERLATLRDASALRAWLSQIAVSLARRRLRRARLSRLLGLDRPPGDATLAELSAPGAQPDDRAELALIDAMLDRMSTDLRIAWMLRRVEGLPLAEVAATCDCSLATAKRRIAAADAIVSRHVCLVQEEA